MPDTRILIALLFAVSGYMAFSNISGGEATHLLVSETAVVADGDGYIGTFLVENRGAPDLLIGVESSGATVSLNVVPVPVGAGETLFASDGFYLRFSDIEDSRPGALVPVQLLFEQAGTVSVGLRLR